MLNWLLNWVHHQRRKVLWDAADRLLIWQQDALTEDDLDESKKHRTPGVLLYS